MTIGKTTKWACKSVSFRGVCHIYKIYVANGADTYRGELCKGCLWSQQKEE